MFPHGSMESRIDYFMTIALFSFLWFLKKKLLYWMVYDTDYKDEHSYYGG